MWKKVLGLLCVASVLHAQPYKRVVYTPFQIATDTTVNYDGNNTSQPDSVWSSLESTGKIAGVPVYRAVELSSNDKTFASSDVIKHYENYISSPLSFLMPSTTGHGGDYLRGDLTWQAMSVAVGDSVTSTTGDTLHFTAGETNWWLENDSATTAHFYLPNPDSATEEGTGVFITTINHALDTVIAVGSIDKNNTMLIFSNGNGGAPGTSTELIAHKGKWYTRNSGVTLQ